MLQFAHLVNAAGRHIRGDSKERVVHATGSKVKRSRKRFLVLSLDNSSSNHSRVIMDIGRTVGNLCPFAQRAFHGGCDRGYTEKPGRRVHVRGKLLPFEAGLLWVTD